MTIIAILLRKLYWTAKLRKLQYWKINHPLIVGVSPSDIFLFIPDCLQRKASWVLPGLFATTSGNFNLLTQIACMLIEWKDFRLTNVYFFILWRRNDSYMRTDKYILTDVNSLRKIWKYYQRRRGNWLCNTMFVE